MKLLYKFTIFFCMIGLVACHSNQSIKDEYKDADAVYLSLQKEYTLNMDGSEVYKYSKKMKLQSYAAFNNLYGDSHIIYNSKYQNVIVNKSTTKNTVESVESGDNAINDIYPFSHNHSAFYSSLRDKVVSHLGTELGCTIDFDYTLNTSNEMRSEMYENILIPQDAPSSNTKIIINIPSNADLNYQLFNSDVAPTIVENEGVKTYTWVFKNVDAIVKEPNISKFRKDLPRLVFSTYTDKSITDDICSHIKSDTSNFAKTFCEKYKLKNTNDVYNYVLNNIALNSFNLKTASYTIRDPKEILKVGDATAYEKAFLMQALLKGININSDVLVSFNNQMSSFAKQNADVWENVYISINKNNKNLLLSLDSYTKTNELYNLEGDILLNLQTGVISKPNIPSSSLEGTFNINLINKASIYVESTIDMRGEYTDGLNAKSDNYLKKIFRNTHKVRTLSDTTFSYSIISRNNLTAGQFFRFLLPETNKSTNLKHIDLVLENRKLDLDINKPIKEEYSYKIFPSKWYNIVNRDTSFIISNSIGEMKYSLKTSRDRSISIEKSIILNSKSIKPEDYDGLKEIINAWNNKNTKELWFNF